jgi:hypothetical protein
MEEDDGGGPCSLSSSGEAWPFSDGVGAWRSRRSCSGEKGEEVCIYSIK